MTFKPGDRVRLIDNDSLLLRIGETATVGKRSLSKEYIEIEWDNPRNFKDDFIPADDKIKQHNGGYFPGRFELIEDKIND